MQKSILRIEKMENGFSVEICDPQIMASNDMPKSVWQEPWKAYAFKTSKEVKTFVGDHLDALKPPPDPEAEYHTEFKRQTGDY